MDLAPSPFLKQLLLDLRDAVRSLRHEKASLQCQLQDAERRNADLQGAMADARRENAALQAAYGEDAVLHDRRDVHSLESVLVGRTVECTFHVFNYQNRDMC